MLTVFQFRETDGAIPAVSFLHQFIDPGPVYHRWSRSRHCYSCRPFHPVYLLQRKAEARGAGIRVSRTCRCMMRSVSSLKSASSWSLSRHQSEPLKTPVLTNSCGWFQTISRAHKPPAKTGEGFFTEGDARRLAYIAVTVLQNKPVVQRRHGPRPL